MYRVQQYSKELEKLIVTRTEYYYLLRLKEEALGNLERSLKWGDNSENGFWRITYSGKRHYESVTLYCGKNVSFESIK